MKKRRMSIMAKNEVVKDSGSMQSFGLAHRDTNFGKGDMSLVPLEFAAMVMGGDEVLTNIAMFLEDQNYIHLIDALQCSINTVPVFQYENFVKELEAEGIEMHHYDDPKAKFKACVSHLLIEVSKLYASGADKYGRHNYKFGMPCPRYVDSGVRHYLKTLRGDIDEVHYRGFVWNMLCAAWTAVNKPEFNVKDEPEKHGKQSS
jgi:hypothetical protein